MKILTVNINSIRAHIGGFLAILESREYDVIAVQELKCEDAAFPHILFDSLGYNIKVHGQKSYNGVAVFSRLSVEDAVRGMPDYADPNARFIECLIDGRIRLINVYMPNGETVDSLKFAYKIEWMKKFDEYIYRWVASEEPVVICGDFNVAIEDRDVWNPKAYEGSSISAPAARKIMLEWMGQNAPWTDEYRHFHPDEIGYTWFGYRGANAVENSRGLRLDYFMTNKAAAKLVKDCRIDMRPRLADKPTDHAGLALELE